jgi:primosomal protein N' (replication factor Y)
MHQALTANLLHVSTLERIIPRNRHRFQIFSWFQIKFNGLTLTAPAQTTIEVAVAMPVRGTFTYGVPASLRSAAGAGKRVLVPFGRRRATGYILGPECSAEPRDIKPILDVLDESPIFPPTMIPFFRWTAEYYKYPLGEVIQTALPGGLTLFESVAFRITEKGLSELGDGRLSGLEEQILQQFVHGRLREHELRRRLGQEVPGALFASLERRGALQREVILRGGSAKPLQERWVRAASVAPAGKPLSPKKRAILEALASAGEVPMRELTARIPRAATHLRALAQAGHLEVFSRRLYRDPFGEAISPDSAPGLTAAQQAVVNAVCASLGKGFRTFLLKGVTGSGKTEVYMRAAAEALASGHSVLLLVPEIALITQTERRFRARFGEAVAVLHSGLSQGERLDQWVRVLRQEARIAIGVRSAVFAPFSSLGLIMVDEEHDASYKQEGGLHYSARDLAVVRAQQLGAVALLGSATPSLQSYHNVRTGKYTELALPQRIEERPLPEVRVVDLRQCRDLRGPGRLISAELNRAMAETLGRGEQALLFLNRRGFASFPVCAACGSALRCRHCDISLTLHQAANAYRCHYCGFSRPATAVCEACGANKIKRLGMGTEKVEAAARALFPEARIGRMDRDTTRRKGEMLKLLKSLREKTIDVVVGTQMVAKGHDFPDITLVGIICADLSLSFPDFRAGERTFQLLAQVAGRAGRGEQPGRVILQTYNPEHFSIRAARDQDFEAFYAQEIGFRKALGYPPLARMIQLRISGRDAQRTRRLAEALGEHCRSIKALDAGNFGSMDILGPIEAPLSRIAGHFRWQILVKSVHGGALHRFMDRLINDHPQAFAPSHGRVAIDVDPLFMM